VPGGFPWKSDDWLWPLMNQFGVQMQFKSSMACATTETESPDHLVLADPVAISTKAQKATRLGVEILSEDGLIRLTSGRKPLTMTA